MKLSYEEGCRLPSKLRGPGTKYDQSGLHRSRWAAIGAAVAVAVGFGGLMSASATIEVGERAVFVPIAPCRLLDTRPGSDNVGTRADPLGPNDTYTLSAHGAVGRCTLPSGASGLVMNVAAIAPSSASFLTVFPAGVSRPTAASLNWVGGQPPLSNSVTTALSADGRVSFFNFAGTVHLAVDVVGYYIDHNHDDRYYTKTEIDSGLLALPKSAGKANGIIPAGTGFSGLTAANPVTASSRPLRCLVVWSLQVTAGKVSTAGDTAAAGSFMSISAGTGTGTNVIESPPGLIIVGNALLGKQPSVSRGDIYDVAIGQTVSFGAGFSGANVDPDWRSGPGVDESTFDVTIAYSCS